MKYSQFNAQNAKCVACQTIINKKLCMTTKNSKNAISM